MRGGACGLWHFGQKKNPARIATMVRHTRTTMAVMAAGPTGFGVSGIPVVVAGIKIKKKEVLYLLRNQKRSHLIYMGQD